MEWFAISPGAVFQLLSCWPQVGVLILSLGHKRRDKNPQKMLSAFLDKAENLLGPGRIPEACLAITSGRRIMLLVTFLTFCSHWRRDTHYCPCSLQSAVSSLNSFRSSIQNIQVIVCFLTFIHAVRATRLNRTSENCGAALSVLCQPETFEIKNIYIYIRSERAQWK